MPKKILLNDFFIGLKLLFEHLPDRQKINYLKDLADTTTKYTGGKTGNIGIWWVEMWPFHKNKNYDKLW